MYLSTLFLLDFIIFGRYIHVVTLAERYQIAKARRVLDCFQVFFEGIAALCLARDTQQAKWREVGKKAVESMSQLAQNNRWTFENKLLLLKAELYYLNRNNDTAELAYLASIASAREHRFIHEEALAYELYGIFCVENGNIDKGMEQLDMALQKYIQWGALKKVEALRYFMYLVDPVSLRRLKLIPC